MKTKLLEIINHYGIKHQQRKLAEEVFELQEAITQKEYPAIAKGHKNEEIDKLENDNIAEELTDVIVLVSQIKEYYGISDAQLGKIMDFKVYTTLERIKEEGK